jgi:transposase
MIMTQSKQFFGLQTSVADLHAGIDVHKSKWVVSVYGDGTHVKTYSMEPSAERLAIQLKAQSQGAKVTCCYEAGFSGFWLQRSLEQSGISCRVVHAADVPSTDRTKKRKTDMLDSQTLALMLSRDLLQGIYVPSPEQEKIRGLVRVRQSMAKDKRRAMARIRSFAFRSGLAIPPELANKLWTRAGQRWLEEQSASDEELSVFVDAYKGSRQLEADAIRVLGARIKASDEYAALQELLRSIPGVGRLTSALLIGEIGDMGRFKNLDHLAGYCGLVPDERSSGEKTRILGLTKRRNPHLRTALVESAWVAIRTDDKLRQTYQKALGEAKTPQVAIIKVARRLLNRVRAVWLQGRPYDKDHAPGQGQPADGGSGGT